MSDILCKFCNAIGDFRLVLHGIAYEGGRANLWQCNACKNMAAFKLPEKEPEDVKIDKEFWNEQSYYDYTLL